MTTPDNGTFTSPHQCLDAMTCVVCEDALEKQLEYDERREA